MWPKRDILERQTAQRKVADNHVNKKEVTFTSSGFWPSPMPKQPEGHLAAWPIQSKGGHGSLPGPRLRVQSPSPRALWDLVSLWDTAVRSPPPSGAALPHLEPTCRQGVPAFYSHTGPCTSGYCTPWASLWLGCLPNMAGSQPCLQVIHCLITRLPQTHPSFCSQAKGVGLGSARRDPLNSPRVDSSNEHQQPNCRATFVFLKFLFALISFRCTHASF